MYLFELELCADICPGVGFAVLLLLLLFLSFVFLGPHPWHMEVPRPGSNQSCSLQPTPEPQQHWIRAASATYATAHGNAGSLTH